MGIIHSEHSHHLAPNPLAYSVHQKALPEHAAALALAQTARIANFTYGESTRLLSAANLRLVRNSYNNIIRDKTLRNEQEILEGLLICLEDEGFTYRTRWTYIENKAGFVEAKTLEQIFFLNDLQIDLIERFCCDWVIEIDATFKTNVLKMPLFVLVGITNIGRSFPAAFFFIISESTVAFDFIWACLKALIWGPNTGRPSRPPPQVVIADEAAGLISSMGAGAVPGAVLQFCQWHAGQNIRKKLAEAKYSKAERQYIDDFIWAYIKSPTEEILGQNHGALLNRLRTTDPAYINVNWLPKERQIIRCYVQEYPNLGANSTQQNESMHPPMKALLSPQTSLQQACRMLSKSLESLTLNIREEEEKRLAHQPRIIDRLAFRALICTVSIQTIEKLTPEWEETKKLATHTTQWSEECPNACAMLVRHGLPCRHWLLRACIQRHEIPLSLLHPRYIINGPPAPMGWKPHYFEAVLGPQLLEMPDFVTATPKDLTSTVAGLLDLEQTLNHEERDLLTAHVSINH